MSLFRWIVLLMPAAIWVWIVVVPPGLRNRRVLVTIGVGTVLYYGAYALPGATWLVQSALTVALLVALLWPQHVGLMSPRDSDANARFEKAFGALRAVPTDPAAARRIQASLARGSFPIDDGDWAVAATLLRRALQHRIDGEGMEYSAAGSFTAAAREYWWGAVRDHLFTRHPDVDAWDESRAIQGYLEEFMELVPRQAFEEIPLVPVGDWPDRTSLMIGELSRMPARTPQGREIRDAATAYLTAELAIALGDRTLEAMVASKDSGSRLRNLETASAPDVQAAFVIRMARRQTLAQRLHLRPVPVYEPPPRSVAEAALDELAVAALAHEDTVADHRPAADEDRSDGAPHR